MKVIKQKLSTLLIQVYLHLTSGVKRLRYNNNVVQWSSSIQFCHTWYELNFIMQQFLCRKIPATGPEIIMIYDPRTSESALIHNGKRSTGKKYHEMKPSNVNPTSWRRHQNVYQSNHSKVNNFLNLKWTNSSEKTERCNTWSTLISQCFFCHQALFVVNGKFLHTSKTRKDIDAVRLNFLTTDQHPHHFVLSVGYHRLMCCPLWTK